MLVQDGWDSTLQEHLTARDLLENGGPGLSRCIYFLLKMGDIPASYVIVYQAGYYFFFFNGLMGPFFFHRHDKHG